MDSGRRILSDEQSGFERHLLSPTYPSTNVEFILNVIPPGKESGTFPAHKAGVKEYVVVARGKLRVVLGDGGQTYDLAQGEAMYFEADVSHRFMNTGGGECRYYLVIDSSEPKRQWL